jgi:uncharacterized membrane protein YqjE
MPTDSIERSFSSVLRDIVQNVQEIVRSEIRLASTEIREEVIKKKIAGLLLLMGVLSGIFAVLFTLLGLVFALSRVVPDWAAAIIVAASMGVGAFAMTSAGRKRLREVHSAPVVN